MTKKQKLVYQPPRTEIFWMEVERPIAVSGDGGGHDIEDLANQRHSVFDNEDSESADGGYKRTLW
ncbi:MAG: hypothetical protein J6M19_00580 [Bacteroidaceae bacterium]|nr:hypothetical protein [Bacteroidaceae bacterium]